MWTVAKQGFLSDLNQSLEKVFIFWVYEQGEIITANLCVNIELFNHLSLCMTFISCFLLHKISVVIITLS